MGVSLLLLALLAAAAGQARDPLGTAYYHRVRFQAYGKLSDAKCSIVQSVRLALNNPKVTGVQSELIGYGSGTVEALCSKQTLCAGTAIVSVWSSGDVINLHGAVLAPYVGTSCRSLAGTPAFVAPLEFINASTIGCTDPLALNYKSTASIGLPMRCVYAPVDAYYQVAMGVPAAKEAMQCLAVAVVREAIKLSFESARLTATPNAVKPYAFEPVSGAAYCDERQRYYSTTVATSLATADFVRCATQRAVEATLAMSSFDASHVRIYLDDNRGGRSASSPYDSMLIYFSVRGAAALGLSAVPLQPPLAFSGCPGADEEGAAPAGFALGPAITPEVPGCTDTSAANYNPSVVVTKALSNWPGPTGLDLNVTAALNARFEPPEWCGVFAPQLSAALASALSLVQLRAGCTDPSALGFTSLSDYNVPSLCAYAPPEPPPSPPPPAPPPSPPPKADVRDLVSQLDGSLGSNATDKAVKLVEANKISVALATFILGRLLELAVGGQSRSEIPFGDGVLKTTVARLAPDTFHGGKAGSFELDGGGSGSSSGGGASIPLAVLSDLLSSSLLASPNSTMYAELRLMPNYRRFVPDSLGGIVGGSFVSLALHVGNGSQASELEVSDLAAPVQIRIPIDRSAVPTNYEFACAFWDTGTKDWGGYGCEVASASDTLLVCNCTHLTDFIAVARALDTVTTTGQAGTSTFTVNELVVNRATIAALAKERHVGLYTSSVIVFMWLILFAVAWRKDRQLQLRPEMPGWKRLEQGTNLVAMIVRVAVSSSLFAWYLRTPGQLESCKQCVTRLLNLLLVQLVVIILFLGTTNGEPLQVLLAMTVALLLGLPVELVLKSIFERANRRVSIKALAGIKAQLTPAADTSTAHADAKATAQQASATTALDTINGIVELGAADRTVNDSDESRLSSEGSTLSATSAGTQHAPSLLVPPSSGAKGKDVTLLGPNGGGELGKPAKLLYVCPRYARSTHARALTTSVDAGAAGRMARESLRLQRESVPTFPDEDEQALQKVLPDGVMGGSEMTLLLPAMSLISVVTRGGEIVGFFVRVKPSAMTPPPASEAPLSMSTTDRPQLDGDAALLLRPARQSLTQRIGYQLGLDQGEASQPLAQPSESSTVASRVLASDVAGRDANDGPRLHEITLTIAPGSLVVAGSSIPLPPNDVAPDACPPLRFVQVRTIMLGKPIASEELRRAIDEGPSIGRQPGSAAWGATHASAPPATTSRRLTRMVWTSYESSPFSSKQPVSLADVCLDPVSAVAEIVEMLNKADAEDGMFVDTMRPVVEAFIRIGEPELGRATLWGTLPDWRKLTVAWILHVSIAASLLVVVVLYSFTDTKLAVVSAWTSQVLVAAAENFFVRVVIAEPMVVLSHPLFTYVLSCFSESMRNELQYRLFDPVINLREFFGT